MDRKVMVLTAFTTLTSFGVGMLFPYIPIFGREIGMPIGLIGFLIFAYYGIEVIVRIPIGSVTDIIGSSRVVAAGALMIAGASLFYILSEQTWQLLFLAQMLLGVGVSITWVTIPAFITRVRGSLPIYTFSVGLGWLCALPFGGFIKDIFGMYFCFFLFLFVSAGVLVLALLFLVENEKNPTSGTKTKMEKDEAESFANSSIPELVSSSIDSYGEAFDLLKRKRRIWIAALVSFLMFMSFAMGSSLIPLYLDKIGLTSFLIGVLLAIRIGTATGIRLGTSRIVRLESKSNILIIGMIITGGSILLFSLTSSFIVLVLLSILWGIGGGIYLPVVFDLIADATVESERGVGMGIRGTVGTAGSTTGVLVFTNLAEFLSVQHSLTIFGIFSLVTSIVLYLAWIK